MTIIRFQYFCLKEVIQSMKLMLIIVMRKVHNFLISHFIWSLTYYVSTLQQGLEKRLLLEAPYCRNFYLSTPPTVVPEEEPMPGTDLKGDEMLLPDDVQDFEYVFNFFSAYFWLLRSLLSAFSHVFLSCWIVIYSKFSCHFLRNS